MTTDIRLNANEIRQFDKMKFVMKKMGDAGYEASMYDRPEFWRSDSPIARGFGKNIHEAKIAAFIEWSRGVQQ